MAVPPDGFRELDERPIPRSVSDVTTSAGRGCDGQSELAYLSGADQAAERMADLLRTKLRFAAERSHIWWGVSVERPAARPAEAGAPSGRSGRVRFLSVEPLLEDLGAINLAGIDWVIVGGESGRGARPMKPEWVVEFRDQCQRARCRVLLQAVGRRSEGRSRAVMLNGRRYDEFPGSFRETGPGCCDLVASERAFASLPNPKSSSLLR